MDTEKEVKKADKKFKAEIQARCETIGIDNDFIFSKVMQDKELLAELIRMILPELEFTDLEIEAQKSIEHGMDIHGVRFDIFVTTEKGETVEIEMQVIDTGNLPKRLRYYGASADVSMLEKGLAYSKLCDSYVILICSSFDPYGEGLHRYTFTNTFEGRCNVFGVASADGKALVGLGGKELLICLHLLVAHQLFSFGLGCVIEDFLRTTVFELLQSLRHISIGFRDLPAGEFMSDGLCAGLCFLPVVIAISDKVGGR